MARPLLLIFDNAHDLDDASLRLLRETSVRLAGRRVGFVAALRHTDLDPVGAVGRWRDELLTAGSAVLEVTPLGPQVVSDWLSQVRRMTPTTAAVRLAWERSGGVPLALEQVSLDPHDDGWDDEGPSAVSPKVHHALRSSFTRRGQTCRDWLAAVAVASVELRFDPVLIAHVAGLPQQLADQCQDEARRAAIVRGTSVGRLVHEQWRKVILAELGTPRTRDLHARAFHALREHAEQVGDTSAETAVRLARHALAGRPHVEPSEAASAVLAAAQGARRRFDYQLGVDLCRRGLEIATDPGLVFDLMLERGDAQYDAGDLAEADASYAKAGKLASTIGDREGPALAALRSARIWWSSFRANPDLGARLESALDQLDPTATPLRAQLQAYLARALALAPISTQVVRRNLLR